MVEDRHAYARWRGQYSPMGTMAKGVLDVGAAVGRDVEEGEEVGDPGPALAGPRAPEMKRLLFDAVFAGAVEWRVGARAIRLS